MSAISSRSVGAEGPLDVAVALLVDQEVAFDGKGTVEKVVDIDQPELLPGGCW